MGEIVLAVLTELGIIADVKAVYEAVERVMQKQSPFDLELGEDRCSCQRWDPDDLDDMQDLDEGRAYIWNRRSH